MAGEADRAPAFKSRLQRPGWGETKVVLRAVAKKLLPASPIDRPKMGFAIRWHEWFHDTLGDADSDLVLAPNSATCEYVDRDVATSLLVDHRPRRALHVQRLWTLLMFEQWARTWLPVAGVKGA